MPELELGKAREPEREPAQALSRLAQLWVEARDDGALVLGRVAA